MKPEDSTASHQQHQGLLDSMEFTGRDYTGKQHKVNLRDSDGTLGVTQIGDQYKISSYDNVNDRHIVSDELIFSNESDAKGYVAQHGKDIKSYIVQENRPPASVDERMRLQEQRKRHAKEREDGSMYWNPN